MSEHGRGEWRETSLARVAVIMGAGLTFANPPFNISDWGGERLAGDRRWRYGAPPKGNTNFAWVQHIVHHLAPAGVAGFVLANGSMSSNQLGEGGIPGYRVSECRLWENLPPANECSAEYPRTIRSRLSDA